MALRLNVEALEARETPSAAGLYAIGAGTGYSPRVQVFDTTTGTRLADFLAYEANFGGGVNVAVADVNADTFPEVIVAAGPGGGPRVRVFDGRAFRPGTGFPTAPNNGTAITVNTVMADFFAFESNLNRGTTITAGNITGTVNAEIIVGAGSGGGPRVRIFDGAAITARQRMFNTKFFGDVSADFFAYESSFRNGVQVSYAPGTNLAVAPGLGGAPRIRVLNAAQIATQGLNYNAFRAGDVVADFFAGNPNSRSGAFVTIGNFDPLFRPTVAVGSGVGTVGNVGLYSYQGTPTLLDSFPVSNANYSNGVSVGSTVQDGFNLSSLLFGFGGQGLTNKSFLLQYNLSGGGTFTRTIVKEITIDPIFLGRPAVSN